MQIGVTGGSVGKKVEQHRRIRVGVNRQQRPMIVGPGISHDLIDEAPCPLLGNFFCHLWRISAIVR